MIRVCHVVSGDLWAGAESAVLTLVRGLAGYADIELSAVLLNEGKLARELRKLPVRTEVVAESRMSFLRIVSAVRTFLDRTAPDIIHSHRYKENMIAFLSGKKRGVKLIGTQHGMPELTGERIRPRYRFTSQLNCLLLSRCFDNVVSVSRDIRNYLVDRRGLPGDRVRCIHNGIGIPDSGPAKREREMFVIGSSGRFFPVKDYPLMVEIARELRARTCAVRFELAGEGPGKTKIQGLIRRYGLEKSFLLPGFVDDVSSFYRGIDLYISTSLHEGIPMSVLEAMAHRIPVIAPRVGGFPEIIDDGVQGYLVEGRDPGRFAEKCLALSGNKALLEQMSYAAREKAIQEFSAEHMAGSYYRLYAEAMNSS